MSGLQPQPTDTHPDAFFDGFFKNFTPKLLYSGKILFITYTCRLPCFHSRILFSAVSVHPLLRGLLFSWSDPSDPIPFPLLCIKPLFPINKHCSIDSFLDYVVEWLWHQAENNGTPRQPLTPKCLMLIDYWWLEVKERLSCPLPFHAPLGALPSAPLRYGQTLDLYIYMLTV